MKPCPVCCVEFEASGPRRRKYCSRACFLGRGKVQLVPREQLSMAAHLIAAPIYCTQCGQQFIRRRIDQVTCSAPCSWSRNYEQKQITRKARREHHKAGRRPKKCEHCRTDFKPSRPCQMYCCRKCQDADRNARVRALRQTQPGDLS